MRQKIHGEVFATGVLAADNLLLFSLLIYISLQKTAFHESTVLVHPAIEIQMRQSFCSYMSHCPWSMRISDDRLSPLMSRFANKAQLNAGFSLTFDRLLSD